MRDIHERFWERVDRGGPVPERTYRPVEGNCWIWTGSTGSHGYGQFSVGRRDGVPITVLAHRWAYEDLIGVIPERTLDHLCLNKLCVNPDHLESVSIGENSLRALEVRGTCKRGLHPRTGTGRCKPCWNAYMRDLRVTLKDRKINVGEAA